MVNYTKMIASYCILFKVSSSRFPYNQYACFVELRHTGIEAQLIVLFFHYYVVTVWTCDGCLIYVIVCVELLFECHLETGWLLGFSLDGY